MATNIDPVSTAVRQPSTLSWTTRATELASIWADILADLAGGAAVDDATIATVASRLGELAEHEEAVFEDVLAALAPGRG